jgi:hypothetical protein
VPDISQLSYDDLPDTQVEVPPAIKASVNSPAFAQLADELATRLAGLRHQAAMRLSTHGRLLASVFHSWPTCPPTDSERREALSELLSFNRAALDLLTGSR